MGQGDFFVQFMDLAEGEMKKNMDGKNICSDNYALLLYIFGSICILLVFLSDRYISKSS